MRTAGESDTSGRPPVVVASADEADRLNIQTFRSAAVTNEPEMYPVPSECAQRARMTKSSCETAGQNLGEPVKLTAPIPKLIVVD